MPEFTEEPRYARYLMLDKDGKPLPESIQRHIKLVAEEYYETPLGRFGCDVADYERMQTRLREADLGMNATKLVQIGRPMYDIVKDLNQALKELGIEPEEYGFSFSESNWYTAEELTAMNRMQYDGTDDTAKDYFYAGLREALHTRPLPLGFRWIACYPVTGDSEGYYVHIDLVFQNKYIQGIEEIRAAYKRMGELTEALREKTGEWKERAAILKNTEDLLTSMRNKFEHRNNEGTRKMLALAKTWNWPDACLLANAAAQLLGA